MKTRTFSQVDAWRIGQACAVTGVYGNDGFAKSLVWRCHPVQKPTRSKQPRISFFLRYSYPPHTASPYRSVLGSSSLIPTSVCLLMKTQRDACLRDVRHPCVCTPATGVLLSRLITTKHDNIPASLNCIHIYTNRSLCSGLQGAHMLIRM